MPLRDHFHPPLKTHHHWEGFHSSWVNTLVRHLNTRWLPQRYRSEPHIHLGFQVEADVATFEGTSVVQEHGLTTAEQGIGNGAATAVATEIWAPPRPAQTFAVDLPAQDVFEVRVYDDDRDMRLVAVVELVSPANKDRPSHRRAFAVKCAAYLQQRVSVVVVDMVTDRHHCLHTELMQLLELKTSFWPESPQLYALTYRTTKTKDQWHFEVWPEELTLGTTLPTLPLWLADDLAVPLELEPTYEETCRVLRIA